MNLKKNIQIFFITLLGFIFLNTMHVYATENAQKYKMNSKYVYQYSLQEGKWNLSDTFLKYKKDKWYYETYLLHYSRDYFKSYFLYKKGIFKELLTNKGLNNLFIESYFMQDYILPPNSFKKNTTWKYKNDNGFQVSSKVISLNKKVDNYKNCVLVKTKLYDFGESVYYYNYYAKNIGLVKSIKKEKGSTSKITLKLLKGGLH